MLSFGVPIGAVACDSSGTLLTTDASADHLVDAPERDGAGPGTDDANDAVPDVAGDADSSVPASDAAGTDGKAAHDARDAGGEAETGPCEVVSGAYYGEGGTCEYYVNVRCTEFPRNSPVSCNLPAEDCLDLCPNKEGRPVLGCEYAYPACVPATGTLQAEAGQTIALGCGICPGAGRRPAGLRRVRRRPAATALGEYFAHLARLEAASIHAFARLSLDLRDHAAPPSFVAMATRCSRDETRHARTMTSLAKRHGGEPAPVALGARRARPLEAVIRENAVEGCVRETFGALVATWQAVHAADEGIRRAFSRIAVDEIRHAALAWAVASWADGQLSPSSVRRVSKARSAALAALRREASRDPPAALSRQAGLPTAAQCAALVDVLTKMCA
jgi:hypothetical protein